MCADKTMQTTIQVLIDHYHDNVEVKFSFTDDTSISRILAKC